MHGTTLKGFAMPDHIQMNVHLTARDVHRPITDTFLGQAHIAGTGPEGTTCRQCIFWHNWKFDPVKGENVPCKAGYFSSKHKKNPSGLKRARCNKPILNKANRPIPHDAMSCRMFEPLKRALPAVKS